MTVERDDNAPFLLGVNLPWLQYGCDFGANAWQPDGGLSRPDQRDRLRRSFARLADRGLVVVRWFLLADGRAGLRFETPSIVRGFDDRFWGDFETGVNEAQRAGVRLVPVLLDFTWCRRRRVLSGVTAGGHRGSLAAGAPRQALLERVVLPLFRRCGTAPSILAWDIVNEPEWATWGVGTLDPWASVRPSTLRGFIGEVTAAVHAETRQLATVGLASAAGLRLVEHLGLDVHQVHWYDRRERKAPLARVPEAAHDRPLWLGEFPTAGSRRAPSEILSTARTVGYAGAFAWSAEAIDPYSNFENLPRG